MRVVAVKTVLLLALKPKILLIAGMALAIAALVLGTRVIMRRSGPEKLPVAAVPPPPEVINRFEHIVVRDFRLNQAEGGPFPFVTLNEGRVSKPRLGGFRLGIGKVLELDRLELNLPLDDRAAVTNVPAGPAAGESPGAHGAPTASALLDHALDMRVIRRISNVSTPFTGLSIRELRICVVRGRERVTVIAASSARLADKSLALDNCFFLTENLRQVEAAKARLINENGWRVVAADGQVAALDRVADAVRRLLP